MPIVRTFTPVMAGVGTMRRRTFTLYNVIGALLWTVGITMLGYALGLDRSVTASTTTCCRSSR